MTSTLDRTQPDSPDQDDTATPEGLWTRYRAQYAKLPPPVQMIGLQLWLPVFFVVCFCFCYIYAFHSPQPRDLPVAIIGTPSTAGPLADSLQANADGALDVETVGSVATARSEVGSGDLVAAYAPGSGGSDATLYVASGAQYQLEAVAKATFQPVAAAQGADLDVVDLAPLPAHDSYGTSLFYLALVWTIGGYMVAMFVGMMGAPLKHRIRAAIIVGGGLFTALVSTLLVEGVIGAVQGHFWALAGIGLATTVAVGATVNGLAYFFGRFVTGIALVLFVFVNIPASGGAFPPEFMPQPFTWLHHVVAGAGVMDALRGIVYDVGPGVGVGLLYLLGYLVAGLLLSAVGKPFHERRAARRQATGKPPSMMVAAQGAMAAAAQRSGSDEDTDDEEAEGGLASVGASAGAVVAD